MHLKGGGKIRVGLQILLAIFILLTIISCGVVVKGPLSIDEILGTDVRLPIYYLDSNSSTSYKDLDITYYYFSDPPELRLDTYFTTENSEGEKVRLARMSTFNLSGQLVDVDETKGGPSITISWAQGDEGDLCQVLPRAYRNDRITGDVFQSCLYWLDKDLNQYKLYTIWPEAEAAEFINSLVQVWGENEN